MQKMQDEFKKKEKDAIDLNVHYLISFSFNNTASQD